MDICFHFCWVNTGEECLDPVVNACLNSYCFPKHVYHFMLPVMCENFGYSSFLQTFGINILLTLAILGAILVD